MSDDKCTQPATPADKLVRIHDLMGRAIGYKRRVDAAERELAISRQMLAVVLEEAAEVAGLPHD